MSNQVRVEHVKAEWRDAVTIGQLQDMIEALYVLGHDADTPVTYLYNKSHVWLETVHDVDDDDFDIEVVPVPRVVDSLGRDERHAYWVDAAGDQWCWGGVKGWQFSRPGSTRWVPASPETIEVSGPYTEDLSS